MATSERGCLTRVMTEVGMSDRSDLDMAEAGDVMGGATVMRATETVMTMTPIVANIASMATLEPVERNENGKRRSSNNPAAAMSPGGRGLEKPHG
jgi:hypothetical protein